MKMLVSQHVYGTIGLREHLLRFSGENILKPQSKYYLPDIKFIEWHASEVFMGPHREY